MASPLVKAVILGQFLALLIAITASSSTALARASISFAALQSAGNYFLLALIYGSYRIFQGTAGYLTRPWWQYAALAVLDVEANFLVVTSFRFTSLTSVTLLDCWSIPVALILTRLLGLAVYKPEFHYSGAALCVLGLAILVATDRQFAAGGDPSTTISSSGMAFLWGDILVIFGATLYAACNVLQEHLLGEVEPSELLCMLGFFGLAVSLVQGLPLELPTALDAPWKPAVIGPWIGYAASMFSFYSLVPKELEWGGAAILNMSLLSSDLWTALARLLFFEGFSAWSALSFAVAFLFVALGIGLYSYGGEAKRGDEIHDESGGGKGRAKYKRVVGISSEDYFAEEGGIEDGNGEDEEGRQEESGHTGTAGSIVLNIDRRDERGNIETEMVMTSPSARRGTGATMFESGESD